MQVRAVFLFYGSDALSLCLNIFCPHDVFRIPFIIMGVNIPAIAAGITIFAIISFKFIMGRIVLCGLIVLQRYLNKYVFRTPYLNFLLSPVKSYKSLDKDFS
ncbi:MAG TPA: hypothetical protein DCE67_01645 [Barnesiella intestinihominis]|nr:MAG: hypothetical protein BHV68_07005 [Bacteroidales bacterium 43_8]HAC12354.1 hypothetical protein [Barnesiella intestinihominis]